jgi:hypothetical protein
MLRHVALVRTDILEELSASFIRVARIGELGTTLAVTSNRRMLRRNTMKWYVNFDLLHLYSQIYQLKEAGYFVHDYLHHTLILLL